MRTTRREVEAVFEAWLRMIGGRKAKSWNDIGGYRLDHNSVYGGYDIEQIVNENGGVDRVFYGRLPARQFVDGLRMSIKSIERMWKAIPNMHVGSQNLPIIEDAAFIVRAVNAHEELLENLKNILARFNERCMRTGCNSAEEMMLNSIQQTIAKAEGR